MSASRWVVALAEPTRNMLGRTPTRGVAHAFDRARGAVIHPFTGPLLVTDQPWPAGGPTGLDPEDAPENVLCLSCRQMCR